MKQLQVQWPQLSPDEWKADEYTGEDRFVTAGEGLLLVVKQCQSNNNHADLPFIAASKSLAAQVVKDWEEAQKECLKDTTEFWRTDMPFMEPKCFVRERELRELLMQAGFEFVEVE